MKKEAYDIKKRENEENRKKSESGLLDLILSLPGGGTSL